MTANAVVRARIDGHIKEEASAVLASMGLTVSDAFRLLLTRVASEKALPFELLVPNQKTIEAIKEARRGKLRSFKSIDSLMDDLNANGLKKTTQFKKTTNVKRKENIEKF